MGKQVSIPDALYSQLRKEAEVNGVPVEAMVAQLLATAVSRPAHDDLAREITDAYFAARVPPLMGEWARVEEELRATDPPFRTLEDAMDYSRRRS